MKIKNTPNTKYQTLNTSSGFTLIEVVISLFIITLLVSGFLANYRGSTNNNSLPIAAQQMASDIRTAQNRSLGSVNYNSAFPAGGWGVHFSTASTTKYTIFADSNGNKLYDVGEGTVAFGGQTITLPAYVTIIGLSTNSNPNASTLDITYLPPDPTTRIFDGTATSSVGKITIKNSITNRIATTTVNVLGLIQVN